jgi:hypothetical protein
MPEFREQGHVIKRTIVSSKERWLSASLPEAYFIRGLRFGGRMQEENRNG